DATLDAPQLPAGWRAMLSRDLQWLASRPVTDNLRYRAESHPAFRYGLDRFHTARLRDALALPPGFNPRTLALAEQLRQETPGAEPAALVQAALKRLHDGGYAYTLEPGLAGTHSADEFWFDTKAGFCEHIASAFVVLMRAAGVPARVVTGYQGGELNALDGYWTVRNADAHAWAEVWLDGRGWTRVDPTGAVSPGRVGQFQRLRPPPGLVGSAIATLSPNALAQLRAVWEAVNNRWNQWVLNYTQSRQLDLLKQLGFDAPSWQDL
ncbi:MAG: transglutaminase-like domain-containing protein, partial [Comamonadaceae bacterium]|nr:transglutaminase-like domain-containing protein [Comamonadaceae bacterium]